MEWQYWAMSALFVAAAALPVIGLFRVYRRSKEDAADFAAAVKTVDDAGPSMGHFDVMVNSWYRSQKRGPSIARVEAVLVGSGLLCGLVASVWAVVDTALA